ncbi:hypothetical protein ES703_33164 [subsurface metagenome]
MLTTSVSAISRMEERLRAVETPAMRSCSSRRSLSWAAVIPRGSA